MNAWTVNFNNITNHKIRWCETLCTLSNGYFATRGAAEEAQADDFSYPAIYLAGGYNRLITKIEGHNITHEDLVNFQNWLPIIIFTEDINNNDTSNKIITYKSNYQLNMQKGTLSRRFRHVDNKGRITDVESLRIVSIANPHIAAIEYEIKPINWKGKIKIISAIDGNVRNNGVQRYKPLKNKHCNILTYKKIDKNIIYMVAKTSQSHITFTEAIRTYLFNDSQLFHKSPIIKFSKNKINQEFNINVEIGQTTRVEKIAFIDSSKKTIKHEHPKRVKSELDNIPLFKQLYDEHQLVWKQQWYLWDIKLTPTNKEQQIIRFNIFHIMQTLSENTINIDVGTPARGLHGEAYRGHVFWDEIFILPFLTYHNPNITRSLLLYRYRRLNAARQSARAAKWKGAMFPWQSASTGKEVSQQYHVNPLSKTWIPDYSSLQYHVNAAIAYNIWYYYQQTLDIKFLEQYGAEMLIEIARFFASIAKFNREIQRYEIIGVMGPDEYHEKYPGNKKPGINNNAYTNVMAVWTLLRTMDVLQNLSAFKLQAIRKSLNLTYSEIKRWNKITRQMFVPFLDKNIIAQFSNYSELKELDWSAYQKNYKNIERLDRILKNEGDSSDNYKVVKQADTVMLFYILPYEELKILFRQLGYSLNKSTIKRTTQYYLQRTTHGSSLSKLVFSSVLTSFDPKIARKLYLQALSTDFQYRPNTTTAEGIHLGLMAGSALYIFKHYLGISVNSNILVLFPYLPNGINSLQLRFQFREIYYYIHLSKQFIKITLETKTYPQAIKLFNKIVVVEYAKPYYFMINSDQK